MSVDQYHYPSDFNYYRISDLNYGMRSSTRLFGMPYQFISSVDPRNDYNVGYRYTKNIVRDAPIISILPGKPKYLPGSSSEERDAVTEAIEGTAEGTVASLTAGATNPEDTLKAAIEGADSNSFKYYDFQRDYASYINYVNLLCRVGAIMLGIGDESIPNPAGGRTALGSYNWGDYRYKYSDKDGGSGDLFSDIVSTGYVQFYVDPDASGNESMSNEVSESKIKGMLETGQDVLKELQFVTGSLGAEDIMEGVEGFVTGSLDALAGAIGASTSVGKALQRIMSTTSNIIKGENIIMPDIYQRSNYEKQYTFTVHLKAPYGNKLGFYLDCYVPLCHLLALGLPKQTTANTYGSPFIVKAYISGVFSCNLGMVTSISINKNINDTFVNVNGVPSEMDVSVTIADLYSDLCMSKVSSPLLFMSNTSLVHYIATTCGIDIIRPAINEKLKMFVQTILNTPADIVETIEDEVEDKIADVVSSFMSY